MSKCKILFSGPPKGTSLHETTSFDVPVLIVKVGAGVLAVGAGKNQKQDAQLSQRDRAAGYISFGRKWKTGNQRQYFTDIVSLASTTVT